MAEVLDKNDGGFNNLVFKTIKAAVKPDAGYVLVTTGDDEGSMEFQLAGGSGYKVYTALLTQSGTDAPVATLLGNNTIGDIVWTRSGEGLYEGTLLGAFPAGKTICPQFPCLAFENNATFLPISSNGNPQLGWLNMYCQSEDAFTINTLDMEGNKEWSDILGSSVLVEIRVYP